MNVCAVWPFVVCKINRGPCTFCQYCQQKSKGQVFIPKCPKMISLRVIFVFEAVLFHFIQSLALTKDILLQNNSKNEQSLLTCPLSRLINHNTSGFYNYPLEIFTAQSESSKSLLSCFSFDAKIGGAPVRLNNTCTSDSSKFSCPIRELNVVEMTRKTSVWLDDNYFCDFKRALLKVNETINIFFYWRIFHSRGCGGRSLWFTNMFTKWKVFMDSILE